jgi:hypothetical protein
VAYLHGTDQRILLADERSASLVGYASVLDAGIATSYKLMLPSVFEEKRPRPRQYLPETQSSTSSIRSAKREKIYSIKSSEAARIIGSEVSRNPRW